MPLGAAVCALLAACALDFGALVVVDEAANSARTCDCHRRLSASTIVGSEYEPRCAARRRRQSTFTIGFRLLNAPLQNVVGANARMRR